MAYPVEDSQGAKIKYHLDLWFGRIRTAVFLFLTMPHKMRRLVSLSTAPIVIGGCNRSGTSLMLSLLSCHPEVVAVGSETHGLCQRQSRYGWRPNPPVRMWRVYKELSRLEIPENATRWCEKSPRNVRNYADVINYFGKHVRIINVVRDGRDVVTSFFGTRDEPMVDHNYWRRFVSYGEVMEGHPQVITVRYEDLVRNPRETMQRVCAHLNLDYVPEFEQYPESARIREHGGFGKARPVSPDSIGRWRQPEFASRVQALMDDAECRRLLARYGYVSAEPVAESAAETVPSD